MFNKSTSDPYRVLGLNPSADREVVRAAFRALAKKYHPDVNDSPGAREAFKLINAAYESIMNGSPFIPRMDENALNGSSGACYRKPRWLNDVGIVLEQVFAEKLQNRRTYPGEGLDPDPGVWNPLSRVQYGDTVMKLMNMYRFMSGVRGNNDRAKETG